jgi:hypothetical protein
LVIGFLRAALIDVRLRSGGAGRSARNLLRRAGEKARRLPRDGRRELALELRAAGVSYREIASALQVDYARVSRWLDDDGRPALPAPGSGARMPATTHAEARPPSPAGLEERVARLEARLDRIEARLDRLIN